MNNAFLVGERLLLGTLDRGPIDWNRELLSAGGVCERQTVLPKRHM